MKTLFNLTTEIAESASVSSPKPPLYNVVFSIYQELGGSNNPKIIYDTLQAMLDEGLVSGGGGGGSVFEGLANAGYSAQDIAAVESISQDDVDLTEDYYTDTSERTDFSRMFSTEYNRTPSLNYLPKIDTHNGTKFNEFAKYQGTCMYVPEYDTSNGTEFGKMFLNCSKLKLVPNLNLEKATSVSEMFRGCSSLLSMSLDFSNARLCENVLQGCSSLTDISLDFSSATNLQYAFQDCTNLVSANISTSETLTGVSRLFRGCSKLVTVSKLNFTNVPANNLVGNERLFNGCSALENVGGFTGLKHSISLQDCPLLTLQSVINILTEAADLTGQTGATLTLHADAKARLTQAEYDLAASKNWTIA